MVRLWTAVRVFFRTLGSQQTAERVRRLLAPVAAEDAAEVSTATGAPEAVAPRTAREALLVLGALQRDARLIDFLKEDLSAYDDAQVGAAVRDVHRDCGKVVERLFAVRPIADQDEGETCTLASGYDPSAWRLTGRVSQVDAPQGVLRHHGWQATRCEIPAWTGPVDAANVLAPAELEVGQ